MTEQQMWLSRRYMVYRMFSNMWFFSAVWVYFYRLYITDQQIGLLDGVAFAIGLLAEVPSGALADKFGRDKMVRIGLLCISGGLFAQILGSSFMPFLAGQAVVMVGFSLISGADDALFFERLKFARNSAHWRKLVMRGSQLALVGMLIATIIGGWLHTINPRLPWLLTVFALLGAAVLVWPVKDERPKNTGGTVADETKDYLRDIKTGFGQFRLPKLRPYVPIIIAVQGLFYVASYGLLRIVLLDRFTFSPLWGAVAIAMCGAITVGMLALMHKHAAKLSEKHVLLCVAGSVIISLLASVAHIGIWGFFVILALYAGEYILQPFMSEVLNKHAPEKQRATVLSVASFLRILPYVCLAPLIGALNTHGQLEYFLVGWAIFTGGAILLYLFSKRRDTKIPAEKVSVHVSTLDM